MIRRGVPSNAINRERISNHKDTIEKVIISKDLKEEIESYSKLDDILGKLDNQSKELLEIKKSFEHINKTIKEIKKKSEPKMFWILIASAITLSATSSVWVRFFM